MKFLFVTLAVTLAALSGLAAPIQYNPATTNTGSALTNAMRSLVGTPSNVITNNHQSLVTFGNNLEVLGTLIGNGAGLSNVPGGSVLGTNALTRNILFVDVNTGDDGTAAPQNASKPYASIGGALDDAAYGDTIAVLPGFYNEAITAKPGVSFHLMYGATVSNDVTFTIPVGISNFVIAGDGTIKAQTATFACASTQGVFRVHADSIDATWAGVAWYDGPSNTWKEIYLNCNQGATGTLFSEFSATNGLTQTNYIKWYIDCFDAWTGLTAGMQGYEEFHIWTKRDWIILGSDISALIGVNGVKIHIHGGTIAENSSAGVVGASEIWFDNVRLKNHTTFIDLPGSPQAFGVLTLYESNKTKILNYVP